MIICICTQIYSFTNCILIKERDVWHLHGFLTLLTIKIYLLHFGSLQYKKLTNFVPVKEKGNCHLCKLLKSVDYSLFAVGKFRRTDQCAANRAVRSLLVLVENKINSMPSTSVQMGSWFLIHSYPPFLKQNICSLWLYYNHVLFNGQVHYTAPDYKKGLYPSIYQG